jgi:parallel beta-helix repeat protein
MSKTLRNTLIGAALAAIVSIMLLSPTAEPARIALASPAPFTTIQAAVNAAQAGDTLVITAGTYTEQVTISKPLTLQAGGIVKVNGFIIKADDVTIEGFDITSPKTSTGFGVRAYNSRCKILDNYIHDTWWDGILLEATSSNCLISGNRIERPSQSGAEVRGTNHIIQNNEVWNTLQTPPDSTFTRSQGADADGFRFFGSGHQFIGNYVHDIKAGTATNPDPHTDCFQSWKDTDPNRKPASDIGFYDNVCFLSWDFGGNTVNASSKIFQFGGVSNVIAKNNISRSRMVSIIQSSSTNVQLTNNTFIGDGSLSWGVEILNSTYITIRDNIFYHQENGYGYLPKRGSTGLNAGHNCVFTTTRTPPGSPMPGDVWGLDPLFVSYLSNDFHLQPSSPCLGIGVIYDQSPILTSTYTPTGSTTPIPTSATPTKTQIPIMSVTPTITVTKTITPSQTATRTPSAVPTVCETAVSTHYWFMGCK